MTQRVKTSPPVNAGDKAGLAAKVERDRKAFKEARERDLKEIDSVAKKKGTKTKGA